jgi:hypothetical protein
MIAVYLRWGCCKSFNRLLRHPWKKKGGAILFSVPEATRDFYFQHPNNRIFFLSFIVYWWYTNTTTTGENKIYHVKKKIQACHGLSLGGSRGIADISFEELC